MAAGRPWSPGAGAAAIVATSAAAYDSVRSQWPATRAYHIVNGVSPGPPTTPEHRRWLAAQLGLPGDALPVAFVGRLSAEKRPDLFLWCCATALRRFPGVAPLLAGAGAEEGRCRDLATSLGVPATFLGRVDDVPRLLAGCAALVCPSDREGTPRAVIEAMFAGLPVIATRVGGVPELLQDRSSGLLVPAGDAGGLAGALTAVLADPVLARDLGTGARVSALRRLSIDHMAAKVLACYSEVAAGAGRDT